MFDTSRIVLAVSSAAFGLDAYFAPEVISHNAELANLRRCVHLRTPGQTQFEYPTLQNMLKCPPPLELEHSLL